MTAKLANIFLHIASIYGVLYGFLGMVSPQLFADGFYFENSQPFGQSRERLNFLISFDGKEIFFGSLFFLLALRTGNGIKNLLYIAAINLFLAFGHMVYLYNSDLGSNEGLTITTIIAYLLGSIVAWFLSLSVSTEGDNSAPKIVKLFFAISAAVIFILAIGPIINPSSYYNNVFTSDYTQTPISYSQILYMIAVNQQYCGFNGIQFGFGYFYPSRYLVTWAVFYFFANFLYTAVVVSKRDDIGINSSLSPISFVINIGLPIFGLIVHRKMASGYLPQK